MASDLFETPIAEAGLHLDVTTDKEHLILMFLLENDISFRFPMTVDVGMRLLALLEQARVEHDFPMPDLPVETNPMQ